MLFSTATDKRKRDYRIGSLPVAAKGAIRRRVGQSSGSFHPLSSVDEIIMAEDHKVRTVVTLTRLTISVTTLT